MRSARLLALLTGVWVVLATAGLVLVPAPSAEARDVCPTLFVPDGLPGVGTVAPPGALLRDVQADLDTLTYLHRYDGVDRDVLYVPADDGRIAWVRDSGYIAGEWSDWQVVVCLGGRVPDAVSRTAADARELVAANRLVPVTDADGSWVVTGLRPGRGEVVPFGSEVEIIAEPAGVRDLAVSDIDASVADDANVDVEVSVQNVGDVVAGPASLFLEYEGDPLEVIDVGLLEPGESAAFSRRLPVPPRAQRTTWTLVAQLEYSDDNGENNRAALPTGRAVTDGPALPDLILRDLDVRAEGDVVVVDGQVVNSGPGDAVATSMRVGVAEQEPLVLPVPALAGGAEYPFRERVPLAGRFGQVEVEVSVDPEGQVEEVDDTNNRVTRVVLLSNRSDLPGQDGEIGSGAAGTDRSGGSGLPAWWWIPAVGVGIVVVAGTRAARAARRSRERDWVRRHLRLRAEPDPGLQRISQVPTGTGSHTVRLEPNPGESTVWVEEVEQR